MIVAMDESVLIVVYSASIVLRSSMDTPWGMEKIGVSDE